MRRPIARSINGIVFGLSTPRRHGNSKSSNFLKEAELEPLGKPQKATTQVTGKNGGVIITDYLK